MKTARHWLAVASFGIGLPALGAPAIVVDAVQAPAWVERGGQKVALQAGAEVRAGDRLATGEDGRLRLKLAEGSTVKLGKQASFGVEKAEAGGVFRATFTATAGAFRFTTDPTRKNEARDVEIKTLHVTAGVRGTDLWGKASPEREFIVLIEGRISVGETGRPPVTLSTPLQYYERKASAAAGVKTLDQATLDEYARETEMGTFAGGPRSIP